MGLYALFGAGGSLGLLATVGQMIKSRNLFGLDHFTAPGAGMGLYALFGAGGSLGLLAAIGQVIKGGQHLLFQFLAAYGAHTGGVAVLGAGGLYCFAINNGMTRGRDGFFLGFAALGAGEGINTRGLASSGGGYGAIVPGVGAFCGDDGDGAAGNRNL